MPKLLSIQVGQPQTIHDVDHRDGRPEEWRTGIYKLPVAGPVALNEFGISGDGQADRANHGGIDKAVLAYSSAHYDLWRDELPETDWVAGGFGENLTIEGLDESSVCIGDLWRVGPVLLEVSQPRQPCWKLCRRWLQSDLAKRVVRTGRTGWYLRVRESGEINPGSLLVLEERPCPDSSVRHALDLMYGLVSDAEAAARLASLPQLSLAWREEFLTRRVV